MGDYMIRGTALEGKIRAFVARTTNLTEELRRRHGMGPLATAAMGRAAAAGAMMGYMLKGEEKLTIRIKGGGPIGQIVVDANARGEVRGYVDEPGVDLPLNEHGKLDVAGAVGTDGFLYVIKDLGMRDPYGGSVPIISGELGEDFTYYFAQSEQTPSAVALGVLINPDHSVRAAGGFILQLLPGVPEEEIDLLERQLSVLPPVSKIMESGVELEDFLEGLLGKVQVSERQPVEFRCNCSLERVERTLISMGPKEIERLLREDGCAEVVCHFCNEAYQFGPDELKSLLNRHNH
ncbi:Hsp33 family molecular chaperone HslO [Paenibacillus thermoaerophilus]|uniref:33 kDa chaperonin n=1 Tax=Paenibacillus thermoaerophilus TaxID=1215385 RepID=A0ABW2V1R0_9BACL|nr:Hsp33 family molecular chaperone HslO [Paenibacillus thermoaerophilus]TMV09441.1 Hsp33 family molecular chaperone HslO [Paenibacillus thermoaerophilus]